jgi:hypothetical protein
MAELAVVAPAFVGMAHRIVWASVATVDPSNRPRTRVLHPLWVWDGVQLVGWIATSPTAVKTAAIEHSPYMSVTYWHPDQDTCTAECAVEWTNDDATRMRVWDDFKNAPAPVGYDPLIVPAWTSPTSPAFAVLRLSAWRLRVLSPPDPVLMWSA